MNQSRRGRGVALRHALRGAMFTALLPAQMTTAAEPGADLTALSLSELMQIKVATVTTASRYEQKVTDAPASVSVVTADEIRKAGFRNLSDVLSTMRGFHITNDRNYKYLGVRGFGLPSDYNSRVLVQIDGIRQNDVLYGSPVIGSAFQVNMGSVERIEVVRGPGSALYGDNAIFAVINVITKGTAEQSGLTLSGYAGNLQDRGAELQYGHSFASGTDLYFAASVNDRAGDDLYFAEFDDPDYNNGVADGRDYTRSQKVLMKLSIKDFTLESIYSHHEKGIPTASWGGLFNADTFSNDEFITIDLHYARSFARWHLASRVSYNQYDYEGEYPSEGDTDFGEAEVVDNFDTAHAASIYYEFHARTSLGGSHDVVLGGSYARNIHQDQKTVYVGADWGFLDDKRSENNWGLFLQDTVPVTDQLTLTAGVRYDHYDSFGTTVNPRIGLVYSPSERTSVKGLYGTAFRAPTAYELHYHDGGAAQIPSPNLEPESTDTYELIVEHYLSDSLNATAVWYHTVIEDLIEQIEDPIRICDFGDPCLIFTNQDKVTATGIELEIAKQWAGGASGRLSYTYQDTELKSTGDRLRNSPRHLASFSFETPLFSNRAALSVQTTYNGSRPTLAGSMADHNLKVDVSLSSESLVQGLEVSASVYNLFDRDNVHPAAAEHEMDQIEQDGREFRLQLTYTF